MVRPDVPPEQDPGSGNVVDPEVFQQRRIGHIGPESLLARASAAERAVVSLEGRLQEIERELSATALQRDELAGELRRHHAAPVSATPVAVQTAPAPPPRVQSRAERLDQRLREVDKALVQLGTSLRGRPAVDPQQTRLRLQEFEADLDALAASTRELKRGQDVARAELAGVRAQLEAQGSELTRLRGETGASDEQLEQLRAELSEGLAALRSARDAHAAAESRASGEQLARERVEAQLQQERARFAQQIEIAEGQVRAEIELQRRTFEEHAASVELTVASLHEQLSAARQASRAKASEPSIDSLRDDLEQAATRLRELARDRGEDEDDETPPQGLPDDVEVAQGADLQSRADDLAQVIKESAGEPQSAPLPARDSPTDAVTAWMAPALRRLHAGQPEVAARVVVDLVPALATDLGGGALVDFAVDEIGAYRLTAYAGTGTISSWQTGASRKADLALAGSALALAPFAVGGAGRRRPKGIAFTGRRRMLRKLLRARRKPVALADIGAAGVVPGLGNLLSLLAANVEPDWIAEKKVAVGFTTTGTGAGSWTVRSGDRGLLTVTPALENCQAVITVPPAGIVALFTGDEPPIAGHASVSGEVDKALLILGWLDRAQRVVS